MKIPCTKFKDAVCAPIDDSESHHLQKNRIHFFDDIADEDQDEEMHSKNFVRTYYDSFFSVPPKEHHKKAAKHLKSKHEEKHHHKKKHFEFDDKVDEFDSFNDDLKFNSEENLFSQKRKHKKHYEFNKKPKHKYDDLLSSEKEEDDKLHFIFGDKSMKAKKKTSQQKKINADEETLEEWLKQSQKQLKLKKDDFLKTLKEENSNHLKVNKKVRLNSPIYESGSEGSHELSDKKKTSKEKKHSDEDNLKVLTDLEESDDGLELTSLISDDEDNRVRTPIQRIAPGEPSTVSEIIDQVKTPDEVIRDEMGKHVIYEKAQFNVIPFAVGKDPEEKKPFYSKHHSSSLKKGSTWVDEQSGTSESNKLEEPKLHDVVSLPFTAAETLVWDWQAVAVASAVASCLVFFLVLAIYFIVNARQWKKVNKTYNKEIEEMSTRIALMQPTLESGSPDSHTTSLHMENIVFPAKEDEKKGDQKV